MKSTASPIAMSYDGPRNEYIDQSIEKFIKAMAVVGAVFESTGSVKSHKCPALLDELPRQA